MRRRRIGIVRVAVSPLDRKRGTLIAGPVIAPCALGRAGAGWKRREGDGATPVGTFPLRLARFRADRVARPVSGLAVHAIRPGQWWCDMPDDRAYNRLVTSRPPPVTSEEWLERADDLYDILVEIGFNDRPVVRGRGSGIFWHGARPGFTPTAGCVATSLPVLARLAPFLDARTRIVIGEGYSRRRPITAG